MRAVQALLAGAVLTMLGAFAEAVRATFQPCTFLLVVPVLIAVLAAGATWAAVSAALVAATLGGWLLAANWWVLDAVALQAAAVLAVVALCALAAAATLDRLAVLRRPAPTAAIVGGVTFAATLWWRPCVGEELGAILTGSRDGLVGQLPGMTAYTLGAMLPVVGVALLAHAVGAERWRWMPAAAAAAGVVVVGALALGRHDEIVVALTRWTT